MKLMKPCGGLTAASLTAWLLLMPPFSVSPAGKTVVDTQASLANWEVFSRHKSDAECRKHRDDLRSQLQKAIESSKESGVAPTNTPGQGGAKPAGKSGKVPNKSSEAFATLTQRSAAARCVASDDPRLRTPAASPTNPAHK
jgi:hypothetical protein